MKNIDKFFVSLVISVLSCQYYGFYLFAGWRGVVTALINMIMYGLIAFLFKRESEKWGDRANTYRAELHNVTQEKDRIENDLYNANQRLYIHGLKKKPENQ